VAARPQNNQLQTKAIALVGMALWLGVLAFGAVVLFVHRAGTLPIQPAQAPLTYAQLFVCVGAVVFALAMRGGIRLMGDGPERNSKILSVWACGNGAALFGAVLFLLSDERQSYAVGLLSMLTTFILVPLRRPT
jgi:hypothetical protein